jgi:hypothetical protein
VLFVPDDAAVAQPHIALNDTIVAAPHAPLVNKPLSKRRKKRK